MKNDLLNKRGSAMAGSRKSILRATLAANIRILRKQKGFSQEKLAERCGLHRTYVGSVERQERNVTLSTLEVLAEALGVTVPELLIGDHNNDIRTKT